MTEKKKKSTPAQYLLYVILAAFVAPYFISQDRSDTVLKVGKTQFSRKDIMKSEILYQQEYADPLGGIHCILSEEARLYANKMHKYLFFLRPASYGLVVSEDAVEQYIKNMPLVQEFVQEKDTFSLTKYTELLKTIGVTDQVMKNDIHTFLQVKQLLIAPRLLANKIATLNLFDQYVSDIWKAFLQIRHGSWIKISHVFNPTFSNEEFKELEEFFINNQEIFMTQAGGTIFLINFNEISDDNYTLMIEDIKIGMNGEELAKKWNADIVQAKILGNKIEYLNKTKTILNKNLIKQIGSTLTQAKENDLNQWIPASDENKKYIYKISSITKQEKASADLLYQDTVKAWKAKDVNNPIIKQWMEFKQIDEQKNLALKGFNKEKATKITSLLKHIIPNNTLGIRDSRTITLTPLELSLGKALFMAKKNKIKLIVHENQVYAVTLERISYNSDPMPDFFKDLIIRGLYNDLIYEYAIEIMTKYR